MSAEKDESDAPLLRAVAEVEDKVAGCHALLMSIDARLARIEAALGRLEGPPTLDAGREVEGVTVH